MIIKSKLNPLVTAAKKHKQWEEITDKIKLITAMRLNNFKDHDMYNA